MILWKENLKFEMKISDCKAKETKHRKKNDRKHPPFADIAKSGAPEKSKASSEFNGWATPPFGLAYDLASAGGTAGGKSTPASIAGTRSVGI